MAGESMKPATALLAVLLLSGCQGIADKQAPPEHDACVFVVNNPMIACTSSQCMVCDEIDGKFSCHQFYLYDCPKVER